MKPKWRQNPNPSLNGSSHSEGTVDFRSLSPTVEELKGHVRDTARLIDQLPPLTIPPNEPLEPLGKLGTSDFYLLYRALLKESEVKLTDDIEEPLTCLEIVEQEQSITFGTLGNFSLIIGKAKSRKDLSAQCDGSGSHQIQYGHGQTSRLSSRPTAGNPVFRYGAA